MTTVHVQNPPPTPCHCGTWLQHWRNFSVLPLPIHCQEGSCRERPELGVVVKCGDGKDTDCFVVPLCKRHSQAKTGMEISSFSMLVSADVTQNCQREH
jgi:hypothetical protein